MSFYSARKKAKISQAAAAEQFGVAAAAVSQWETGKTTPRSSLLPQIAKVYGCTIDELLSGNEESVVNQDQQINGAINWTEGGRYAKDQAE